MNNERHILENERVKIDLTFVYEICVSDQSLIKKLILTFLKNIPLIISRFNTYLAANDMENIYKTAHAARSSLSVIQVSRLVESMILIEKMAQNGDHQIVLKELINEVKQMYADVQEVLNGAFFQNQE